MKLMPGQFGRLAGHVERAIRENPLPEDRSPKRSKAPLEEAHWEVALRKAIDEDGALPNYDNGDLEIVLDWLISYYAE